MKLNTCGLEGSVHVFTHVDSERRTCWGRLTDWNERRCGSEARLRLRLYGRCTVTDRMRTSGAGVATDGYIELGHKLQKNASFLSLYFYFIFVQFFLFSFSVVSF